MLAAAGGGVGGLVAAGVVLIGAIGLAAVQARRKTLKRGEGRPPQPPAGS